jgi:glycosyltransferase involved in cell wall biosynthesis
MDIMRAPQISVILIFLNAAEFISEAIESVLRQTYRDWELILVDDGSIDASTKIARGHARRVRQISYVDHPGHANRGMSASRNLGLTRARGEFIAFIDADDLWLPCKLIEQAALLSQHPGLALVAGSHIEQDGLAEGSPRTIVKVGGRRNCATEAPDALSWMVRRVHPGSCCSTLHALGKMRGEHDRILVWIYEFAKTQPGLPRRLLWRLYLRSLPARFPVLDLPRQLGKAVLPRPLRRLARSKWKSIQREPYEPE